MSSFVTLASPSNIKRHLRQELAAGWTYRRMPSKFCIELFWEDSLDNKYPTALLLSGKEAGLHVASIAAGQRAVLSLGTICPPKYQALVVINPAFNHMATVMGPGMVEPTGRAIATPLDLYISAAKTVNLAELDWFCRLMCFE